MAIVPSGLSVDVEVDDGVGSGVVGVCAVVGVVDVVGVVVVVGGGGGGAGFSQAASAITMAAATTTMNAGRSMRRLPRVADRSSGCSGE
jgi:hypothetical protein